MRSDLVIVYHRQPYEEVEENGRTVLRENRSPNGIVPALKGFFGKVEKGAWVAWKLADDPANPGFERNIEIEDSFGSYTVSRLPLTPRQVESFYHVTSKEAFWPILHGFKEKYNYDPVDWPTFREVNWAFAEAAAAQAAKGAVVWIHDYNLWLVPGYLRQMRPDLRISLFHHTPFPGPDIFNLLPWRAEIIESLLACDTVGFHVPRYASNFVSVVRSLFAVDSVERTEVPDDLKGQGGALTERTMPVALVRGGRRVRVVTSPVGVDPDFIESLASRPEAEGAAEAIRDDLDDGRLLLSVGRTDYTKGGVEQLLAFERLIERRKDLRGKVRLLHVSVAANRGMAVYANIQSEIEQIVGRINGRYGTYDWQPVAFVSRAIPFAELVGFYRAADVAWITPLADGMNLVCKEFAAARVDGDGVLVLSEFAGAAAELPGAVLTNPYSHRSMDHAIDLALDLPEDERRHRMALLRETVRRNDVGRWARTQIEAVAPPGWGSRIGIAA